MQDIVSDFYKRFTREGMIAEKVICPASVCLFTGKKNSCPEVGLRLSFGAEAAVSSRNDGRIVLSRTDSDTFQSINISDYPKRSCAAWASEIISSLMKLPAQATGVQMLLHTDVGIPELAPRILCAVFAAALQSEKKLPHQSVLRSADYPAYYMASLFNKERVCIINPQTLDYLLYDLPLNTKKIVLIKINNRRKRADFSDKFSAHECERISKLALYLNEGNLAATENLMYEASCDMLNSLPDKKVEELLCIINEFTKSLRLLPDYSGAVVFVENKDIDNFIMLTGERYEKKTGTRPAFYISD